MRRRGPRTEPQKIGTPDLPANALDEISQSHPLAGPDVHRAFEFRIQHGCKRFPDVGDMQKTADLFAVRARSFAALQQIANYERHQAIRVLMRAELKENAPPGRRQMLAMPDLAEGPL